MLEVVESANDLDSYLDLLFGGESGYVYCGTGDPSLDRLDKDYWTPYHFSWPEQKTEITSLIKRESASKNVYIAPALFSAPEAKKEFVKGSNVAWVDFDGKIPTELNGCPAPSMIVESSTNKQHWYWRLDNFVGDIKQIERLNRGLAYTLDADISGWDANQVLRPPLTKNHKYDSPQPVTLLSITPYSVNPTAFGSLPEPPTIAVEFNVTDVQDQALIVASYQWTKQAFNLYRTLAPVDRSSALMQLAYFGAEMGMQDVEIFTLLYHADERWGKFKGRPDRVRRLNDIIAKARVKHPNTLSLTITELPVFGFKDFLDAEVEIEWVIPNLLERSGQMLLTAKPGVGKSRFTLAFFIHLALGKSFLHYEISEPQKVVYFSLEMGHAQLLYFLGNMAKKLSPGELSLLQENLLLVPLGEALYLDKPAGQNLVQKTLEKHRPNGYAFDSLSRMTPETVNDEANIKGILDWDAGIRNRFGTYSWYIHHNRKATASNRKPRTLDDILGATVIAANTSAAYTLWSNDPQNLSLDVICVKQRLAEMEKAYVIMTNRDDLMYSERAVLGTETYEVTSEEALGITPPDGSKTTTPGDNIKHEFGF